MSLLATYNFTLYYELVHINCYCVQFAPVRFLLLSRQGRTARQNLLNSDPICPLDACVIQNVLFEA